MKDEIELLKKKNSEIKYELEDKLNENFTLSSGFKSIQQKNNNDDMKMKNLMEENKILKDQVRQLECNIGKMDRIAYGKLVLKGNKDIASSTKEDFNKLVETVIDK